jgi:hypothetical protein
MSFYISGGQPVDSRFHHCSSQLPLKRQTAISNSGIQPLGFGAALNAGVPHLSVYPTSLPQRPIGIASRPMQGAVPALVFSFRPVTLITRWGDSRHFLTV